MSALQDLTNSEVNGEIDHEANTESVNSVSLWLIFAFDATYKLHRLLQGLQ